MAVRLDDAFEHVAVPAADGDGGLGADFFLPGERSGQHQILLDGLPGKRCIEQDSTSVGVDLYHEGAEYQRPFTVWYNGEQVTTDNEAERPRPFYLLAEEKLINKVSFMVCVPPVTIPPRELVYMLPMW